MVHDISVHFQVSWGYKSVKDNNFSIGLKPVVHLHYLHV